MSDDELDCCPEWCDPEEKEGGREHGEVCPESPFAPQHYTKGQFVGGAQVCAEVAITDYLGYLEEGWSHEDALRDAIDQARESAVCFAGIGSCGRGWCQHA